MNVAAEEKQKDSKYISQEHWTTSSGLCTSKRPLNLSNIPLHILYLDVMEH